MRNGDPTDVSFGRIVEVYSAARALHELAFWDWLKKNDEVPFVANCLVPDGQFGRVMDMYNVEHGVSSNGQLKNVMEGNWAAIGLQLGKSPVGKNRSKSIQFKHADLASLFLGRARLGPPHSRRSDIEVCRQRAHFLV